MAKQFLIAMICALLGAGTAGAEQTRGPVTNLALPRYVSLKSSEANVRRGPSLSHRIDWVYTQRNFPFQVVAEHGHWRRIIDIEGAGGWIHYSLLTGTRHIVVTQDQLPAYQYRDTGSELRAYFEKGAIARLGECDLTWCRITAQGHRGWVDKTALWGVEPGELRD